MVEEYEVQGEILDSIIGNYKIRLIKALFGENPVCHDYYLACIENDLQKVEKEIKKGAFAENTYYLLNTTSMCSFCELHGCCLKQTNDDTLLYYLKQKEKMYKTLRELNIV
jgi:hypothetical protein